MELKFEPTEYAAEVGTGRSFHSYYITGLAEDVWSLRYVGPRKRVSVCSTTADGEREDWPSAAMAQLAAQQHYERMRTTGETPDVAASRIPTEPAWYEAKMGETT